MFDELAPLYDGVVNEKEYRKTAYSMLKVLFDALEEMNKFDMRHNDFKIENVIPRKNKEGDLVGVYLIDFSDFTIQSIPELKKVQRFEGQSEDFWTMYRNNDAKQGQVNVPYNTKTTDIQTICASLSSGIVPVAKDEDLDFESTAETEFFRLLNRIFKEGKAEEIPSSCNKYINMGTEEENEFAAV